jgi:flagellar assembly protein FliH
MTPKIIKQGTAHASSVRRFLFDENPGGNNGTEQKSTWADFLDEPAAVVSHDFTSQQPSAPEIDAAQLEKRAFESGYSQGEKTGMEIAGRQVDAAMKKLGDTILEISSLRSAIYAQAECEVVKLAVEVAKKIVHREIQADPHIIQTLVRVALSHVAERSSVTIHLNPADHGYLIEQRSELSENEGRDISLLADKSIEPGGCLIQTDCGDVDARIEEKFREVEHSFFEGSK